VLEHEGRHKRDWRRTRPASAESGDIELAGREPDPAFAAEVAEECERLLARLGDDDLRSLAVRKMEGFTNEEIATQLGCSLATVERRLRLIRREWEADGEKRSNG
jgi:DNA-directed RNA polymerase specialized sigma24 family protein